MALLEEITEADGLLLDIVYATDRVFTGQPVYQRPVAFLLPEARTRLLHANRLAQRLCLRLKIFDAYRPIEAQWVFWHAAPDKSFVADPRQGGIHTRGAAVDLTLVHDSGTELEMGAGFDEFSPLSSSDLPPTSAIFFIPSRPYLSSSHSLPHFSSPFSLSSLRLPLTPAPSPTSPLRLPLTPAPCPTSLPGSTSCTRCVCPTNSEAPRPSG